MKILAVLLLAVAACPASIIVSVEAPGVQYTTVSGVTTETFDSLPAGLFTPFVSPVGTFLGDGVIINPGDDFGGSAQTPYVATGTQSGPAPQTLTLNFDGSYAFVGFYWGAIDVRNVFQIWDGLTLLASYDRDDILPLLSPAYFGNPNTGANPTEAYVYVNFDSDVPFDHVVWINKSDVPTVLNGGWPTGTEYDSVSGIEATTRQGDSPEPGTLMLFCGGALVLAGWRRR